MKREYAKVPIGVLNKKLYDKILQEDIYINGGMDITEVKSQRVRDLSGAICRYAEANMHIDVAWVAEYNNLLSELGVKKIEFKL